jgi:hypothetical protein
MKTNRPNTRPSHLKKWQPGLTRFLKSGLLFLFFVLLFSSRTFSQTAPVNPPSGGFAIDGNLQANTSVGDWLKGTGLGGFVLFNNGTAVDPAHTFNVIDRYNSSLDLIFSGGSKVDDDPNINWHWSAQMPPNKNDINHGLFHLTKDGSNNDWVIVGGDRLATNGDSYIDFEFFQKPVTRITGGKFHSDGTDGGRTVNDLLISIEFNNGGGNSTVWR